MAEHVTERGDHIPDELLSAYLAGDLEDPAAAERIERHLAACARCRAALGELRALRHLLRDLPAPAVPRSFALTPDMVRPAKVVAGPWFVRFQPALRWASAVAALLLVLVLTADLLVHQTGGDGVAPEASTMSTGGGGATGVAPQAAEDRATAGAATDTASPVPDASALEAPVSPTESPLRATESSGAESGGGGAARVADPAVEPVAAPETGAEASVGWRLVEAALALLVVGLLGATLALPRLHARRR
ncbi:MAG: zf-HC2 domain-containing protein [Sphaerobacter sp.]|nr:zf-HC2 domain-containing protein [Sphaerobacter sp.]